MINKAQLKSDTENLKQAILLVYSSDKKLFFVRIGLIIIQSVLPLAFLYMVKLLVDEITNNIDHPESTDLSLIILYAALFCGIFLLTRATTIFNQMSDRILSQKLTNHISHLLHDKSTGLDLSFYDNPVYHDTFHRAQQEANYRPLQLINSVAAFIRNFLSLIGVIALLVSFSWIVILIMLIAGLPSLWVKLVKAKILYNWRKRNTEANRKASYLSKLMVSRAFAKEIRMFRLKQYFQKQFIAIRQKLLKENISISTRQAKLDFLTSIFEAAALMLIIYLISKQAFAGAITVGSFVMYFEGFRRGQMFMQGVVTNLSGIYDTKLFLSNLFEFLNLQPQIKSPESPVPFPEKLTKGIRFDDVSFSYPGSGKKILDKLNLHLKPGEISKIHGENGSGKTTLIKLICRLYECTEGAIYIDEINIKKFDLHELRKNISTIFQDFATYDLSVRDNITLGNIEDKNNDSWMYWSAEYSKARPVIENLPQQYETILGKFFTKGEELSMGQWQRIALARTLYSDAPIILLDEPTSWMDEKAARHFLKNLQKLKRDKLILLVSHSIKKEFEHIKID